MDFPTIDLLFFPDGFVKSPHTDFKESDSIDSTIESFLFDPVIQHHTDFLSVAEIFDFGGAKTTPGFLAVFVFEKIPFTVERLSLTLRAPGDCV